jgi:methyl-accepting chemotaxis protein
MRKGAASTSRALAEQVIAADQIAKSASSLSTMIASVNRAMASRRRGAAGERRDERHAPRVGAGGAGAGRADAWAEGHDVGDAKHVGADRLITTANRTHSTAAGRVLEQLRDIRKITDRNARDVHETRGNTAELVRHAEDLVGLAAAGTALAHGKSNGVNGRG